MRTTSNSTRWLLLFCLVGLTPVVAEAATVGFWQFGADNFLKDSAGSADLIPTGTVSQVVAPTTERGSAFPGTFPAADLSGGTVSGFTTTIVPIANDFTIEAFIHTDNANGQLADLIASAHIIVNNLQSAWALQIRHDGFSGSLARELSLSVRQGTTLEFLRSGFQIEVGRDYYVASAFDLESRMVTFYLQDLPNSGPLLSNTVAHHRTGINSIATLVLGNSRSNDGLDFGLDGLLDEVRLSNTVLTADQLLISPIPIPAPILLLGCATAVLGAIRRRPAGLKNHKRAC